MQTALFVSHLRCRAFVLAVTFVTAGCSRVGLQDDADSSDAPDSSVPQSDSGVALPDSGITPGTDTGAATDATDPVESELRPAPDLPTPERSDELDLLYCSLSSGQLVQAGLRAAACLEQSLAGVLDDASRGFVYGSMMASGYAKFTYGNCDVLRCLNNATDCEQARACDEERYGDFCEEYQFRCTGNTLQQCLWNGDLGRWTSVQDCTRQGAACSQFDENNAGCVGPVEAANCSFYGTCEGNDLVRCTGERFNGEPATEVRIPCNQLVEDGKCIETPVGGEAPGPACAAAETECVNSFADGFGCVDDNTLSICLYGRIVDISCTDFGYTRCGDDGFFSAGCEL
jgi:hypothetical protein